MNLGLLFHLVIPIQLDNIVLRLCASLARRETNVGVILARNDNSSVTDRHCTNPFNDTTMTTFAPSIPFMTLDTGQSLLDLLNWEQHDDDDDVEPPLSILTPDEAVKDENLSSINTPNSSVSPSPSTCTDTTPIHVDAWLPNGGYADTKAHGHDRRVRVQVGQSLCYSMATSTHFF